MCNIKLLDKDAVTAILGVPEKTNSSYGNWRIWCEVTLNNRYSTDLVVQRAVYFRKKKDATEWMHSMDQFFSNQQRP